MSKTIVALRGFRTFLSYCSLYFLNYIFKSAKLGGFFFHPTNHHVQALAPSDGTTSPRRISVASAAPRR